MASSLERALGDVHFDRQREMVGRGSGQGAVTAAVAQARGEQDMVNRTLWVPAREGVDHAVGRLQASAPVEQLHFRCIGTGIEITHQHDVLVLIEHIADKVELGLARLRAQGQMRHRHAQTRIAASELRQQQTTPLHPARQGMIGDIDRFNPAQQAIRAGSKAADAAVGLMAPVREAGAFGQVMRLIGKARAQTARIAFVQTDDVVLGRQRGDRIQRTALASCRKRMRPTAGEVIAVASGTGSRLNIGAEQFEPAGTLRRRHRGYTARLSVRPHPPMLVSERARSDQG